MPACLLLRFTHKFKISAFGILECFFWGQGGRMVKRIQHNLFIFQMVHPRCVYITSLMKCRRQSHTQQTSLLN